MKKFYLLIAVMTLALTASAQENRKFSPEQFEADLEAFITKEAALTQQESAKFFPLLREMHEKQRVLFGRIHQAGKITPADEAAAAASIKECDQLNVELKEIERKYHQKMMKEVPAVKVFHAIKAENRFHRRMMKGWMKNGKPKGPKGQPKDRRR